MRKLTFEVRNPGDGYGVDLLEVPVEEQSDDGDALYALLLNLRDSGDGAYGAQHAVMLEYGAVVQLRDDLTEFLKEMP